MGDDLRWKDELQVLSGELEENSEEISSVTLLSPACCSFYSTPNSKVGGNNDQIIVRTLPMTIQHSALYSL